MYLSDEFDVVSFISSIDRGSSFNAFRSKYGYYTLKRGTDNATAGLEGDTVRIYGYNLFNSVADTVTFGSSAAVTLTDPGTDNFLTVEVPTDATSSAAAVCRTASASTATTATATAATASPASAAATSPTGSATDGDS